MDVAEMIPGHLRLYAAARRTTLSQKALIYSLNRAKRNRNEASERVKQVYKKLRICRDESKQSLELLEEIKKKSHLLPNEQKQATIQLQDAMKRQHAAASMQSGPASIRNRYFKSLKIAPGKMLSERDDISDLDMKGRLSSNTMVDEIEDNSASNVGKSDKGFNITEIITSPTSVSSSNANSSLLSSSNVTNDVAGNAKSSNSASSSVEADPQQAFRKVMLLFKQLEQTKSVGIEVRQLQAWQDGNSVSSGYVMVLLYLLAG
jgi:hypothetical protein